MMKRSPLRSHSTYPTMSSLLKGPGLELYASVSEYDSPISCSLTMYAMEYRCCLRVPFLQSAILGDNPPPCVPVLVTFVGNIALPHLVDCV